MRELQDGSDGRKVADAIERHRRHHSFWDDVREWIEGAQFFGENVIEYPEYDGNSMYRTLGKTKRNPNVGLLFVRFDGQSRPIRINGKASIHTEKQFLVRHYGANFVAMNHLG